MGSVLQRLSFANTDLGTSFVQVRSRDVQRKVQTNKFADTVKFELEKLKPIMDNMQQGIGSAPEDSETS